MSDIYATLNFSTHDTGRMYVWGGPEEGPPPTKSSRPRTPRESSYRPTLKPGFFNNP